MERTKADVVKMLGEGLSVRIFPEGYSMYPMFVPGRDEAVIGGVDPKKLRRGAVVLYRRESGILVLHRILRKGKEGFFMVGDNQTQVEGPLQESQIKGVLLAFVRKGRYIPVSHPVYVLASHLWLLLRPVRNPIMQTGAFLKRQGRRLGKH